MKAITYVRGKTPVPLQLVNVEEPVPADYDLLVRVEASALNTGDVARIRMGLIRTRPAVTGSEFAGTVVRVGGKVSQFKVGEKVYGLQKSGAHAEFLRISENDLLVLMPNSLEVSQAAAIPNGALAALYFLRKSKVEERSQVLIYGASGSVGTYAVQLAKAFGATVTAVCGTESIEMVHSLGADEIIDYRTTDFTAAGTSYDLIFDTVGKLFPSQGNKGLSRGGAFVTTRFSPGVAIQSFLSKFQSRKVLFGIAKSSREDLEFINGLVERGALRSVIDREYPMDRIGEAFEYVESGRKKGNVVLTISSGE